jgi:hypothetical protein
MAHYLRIDGENEVFNMDYVRKMWKADEATEDSDHGLPVIYLELDNEKKLHIKFESKTQRDSTFETLLGKVTITDIVTKAAENFVEL